MSSRRKRSSRLSPTTIEHEARDWIIRADRGDVRARGGALRLILLEHLARTGRRGDDLVFGRTATAPPTNVRNRALGAWAAVAVGALLRCGPLTVELEPIGLHECRHTFVPLMHAAGRSFEEIGDYVGHTSAYMTDCYRHLLDGGRVEAAAALDDLLSRAAQ